MIIMWPILNTLKRLAAIGILIPFSPMMGNMYCLYAGQIKEALEAGMADIVAHPDLFMYGRAQWNDACEQAAQMICDAALAADVPLEVNMGGIKRGLRTIGRQTRLVYPYRRFWEVAARKGNKVVYGLDAHDPAEYLKKEQYDIVDEVIAGLDLHFIKMKMIEIS